MNWIYLKFIYSEQETTCSPTAGNSAPEALMPHHAAWKQSLPATLQGSKREKRGNIFPKDPQLAQLDRARSNASPLPMCRAGFLFAQTWKSGRDWTLELPTGREAIPDSSPGRSPEHTVHTSHPVVMFHSCFRGYQFSANSLSHGPHSAKWLQTPRAKGDADQLWLSLQISYFTANLLRCICLVYQKSICISSLQIWHKL